MFCGCRLRWATRSFAIISSSATARSSTDERISSSRDARAVRARHLSRMPSPESGIGALLHALPSHADLFLPEMLARAAPRRHLRRVPSRSRQILACLRRNETSRADQRGRNKSREVDTTHRRRAPDDRVDSAAVRSVLKFPRLRPSAELAAPPLSPVAQAFLFTLRPEGPVPQVAMCEASQDRLRWLRWFDVGLGTGKKKRTMSRWDLV